MSNRTSKSNTAIAEAWEIERELVLEGYGTRDWTPEQQRQIIELGKAYDENGKAFEGHHMKNAEDHPEYQGDPYNIQFLTREEHLAAHNGDFRNETNGYYDPETGETTELGEKEIEPLTAIQLSEPVYHEYDEENLDEDVLPDQNVDGHTVGTDPPTEEAESEDEHAGNEDAKSKEDNEENDIDQESSEKESLQESSNNDELDTEENSNDSESQDEDQPNDIDEENSSDRPSGDDTEESANDLDDPNEDQQSAKNETEGSSIDNESTSDDQPKDINDNNDKSDSDGAATKSSKSNDSSLGHDDDNINEM